ncbi:MAG: ATP phosphoribosyltransferase [Planctomycetota bacterium]|nr:MAG: ATP phosphoribosyltransferase [Planctomycetota bacterium]
MAPKTQQSLLRIALPKGRMQEGVFRLLADAGIRLQSSARQYRPKISLPGAEVKLLKPQNIIEMLHHGSRDLGFAGADWAAELNGNLIELLDTGLDPVRVVAAAPRELLRQGQLPDTKLLVASEYERLTRKWIRTRSLKAEFVRSRGATEVFPPEDSDCIVDNTATGSTLEANGLEIVEELMTSSTRLYAHPQALQHPKKKTAIEDFVLLLKAVLEARTRVMLELNVSDDRLESVLQVLPCMRQPTIAPLARGGGFAVKAAIPKDRLADLLPDLKAKGGSDLVVSNFAQIVP